MKSLTFASIHLQLVPVAAVFLLGRVWNSPASGEEARTERAWNFDSVEPGALPDGFAAGPGTWKVTTDSTGEKSNRVLAQTGKSEKPVFNLCLVRGTSLRNVDLRVRMRAVSGGIDQGGGVVWRAKDDANYYICRYNPLEENIRVYKVEGGKRVQIAGATVQKHESWYHLRIVMQDDHIRCYMDAKLLLEVRDSAFSEPGTIGLWTKADAVTDFDDLSVQTPLADSMAP